MSEKEVQLNHPNVKLRSINKKHSLAILGCELYVPANIGGLFRLADAVNLSHIYLWGHEVNPITPQVKKNSRSTVRNIPYTIYQKDIAAIKMLAAEHTLVAIEYTNHSIPYHKSIIQPDTIFVLGNEKYGIPQEVLDLCTMSIHIPMYGENSSINVTMSASIIVYDMIHR